MSKKGVFFSSVILFIVVIFFLWENSTKGDNNKVQEILNLSKDDKLEDLVYFEGSITKDYNYPRIYLIKFKCDSLFFLAITKNIGLIGRNDTARINENLFNGLDFIYSKELWNQQTNLVRSIVSNNQISWWNPCRPNTFAFYYKTYPKFEKGNKNNYNGKLVGSFCNGIAFFLLQADFLPK